MPGQRTTRTTLRDLRAEAARYARPNSDREAEILRAAARLFSEKGFAGTRTADIAAAARVTERTLFRYFPTKEALYRRVIFPALLSATVPRLLMDTGALFGADIDDVAEWHRRVLAKRVGAARRAAPQLRVLLAGLMTNDALRDTVVGLWKHRVLKPLLETVRRYQARGALRADLRPEVIARAVISLNLGYVIARALLAPDAKWQDEAEIEATVALLLRGAGPVADSRK
jgi:TetR/AcrR family transcriptional regulator